MCARMSGAVTATVTSATMTSAPTAMAAATPTMGLGWDPPRDKQQADEQHHGLHKILPIEQHYSAA